MVGTNVDIAHLAATPEGMKVTVAVELTGVDRRRLSFRFQVHDEVEKVGSTSASLWTPRCGCLACRLSSTDELGRVRAPGAVSPDITYVLAAHATGYAVGGRVNEVNEVNEERWGDFLR
jgi:Fluoroacetyl-CoA-specific thioesterase